MATLKLEIVTPEGRAYCDEVDMVVLPGSEGEMGILPQHVPLMTQLVPGELHVRREGRDLWMAVGEGLVEITQEKVSILTDMAIEEKEIDETAAQQAMERAEEAMRNEALGAEEIATVEATIQKSLAQIKVKRRQSA